ncbi:hypothetical protein [Primorskyibacter sp. S187A]|uniref:hypothetical protein n=1 Tax=Primorskyibacter sp. S187A TaxID=3415130 RepID=UPI003C7BA3EF
MRDKLYTGTTMDVLIVVSNRHLGALWSRHLERIGATVSLANSQEDAVHVLQESAKDVIILELTLEDGAALAVSDFASYRRPEAKVIFISNGRFFSDGSIFHHCANACAVVPSATRPEDLAALAEHHATH